MATLRKCHQAAGRNRNIILRVTGRQFATILAALRFHQDENLHGGPEIPDQFIREIATDGGLLKPLDFQEVSRLCERLNTDEGRPAGKGIVIEPPPREDGDHPIFRVAFVIDMNADSAIEAARQTHRIMADTDSLPPVLEVIDHRGRIISIDLSQEVPA